MESIQVFAIVNLMIMGLSHMVQPKVWAAFFIQLREKGDVGVFLNGFLHLAFGSLIAAFHNVWSGLPLILTLYGWLLVLKGLVCFVFPAAAMKSLQRVTMEKAQGFRAAGLGLLGLGCLLMFHLAANSGV